MFLSNIKELMIWQKIQKKATSLKKIDFYENEKNQKTIKLMKVMRYSQNIKKFVLQRFPRKVTIVKNFDFYPYV